MAHFPKILMVLVLAIGLLSMPSCKKDDGVITLNYDGDNLTAPQLPNAGTYTGAAKFLASQMATHEGAQLTELEFYILNLPSNCVVRVYKGTIGNAPAETLYEANVTSALRTASWNTHELATPITLTGDDLWLSVEYTVTSSDRVLGCDPGPAVANGNWFNDSVVGLWAPLTEAFPEININWNIRGKVKS